LPRRFVLAGGKPLVAGQLQAPHDLLIVDGRIAAITPQGQGLAVGDAGWSLATAEAEVDMTLEGEEPHLDASGYGLVPAPGDAHVHLLESAILQWGVELSGARTVAEVLERLAAGVEATGGGGMSDRLCWAHSLEPGRLSEKRWPRAAEVERAVAGRPLIVLQHDGHASLTTAAADRLLEARAGRVLVREAEGFYAGARVGADHYLAFSAALTLTPDNDKLVALDRYLERVADRGVAIVHAFAGCPALGQQDTELMHRHRDRWPVDVRLYPQSIDPSEPIVRTLGRRGGCLLIDGSIGSRTAALRSPYAQGAAAGRPRGRLYFSDDELRDLVTMTHHAGHQLVLHAIGDRAVDQVLTAMSLLHDPRGIRTLRHRIEHAVLLHPDQVERIAELGLVVGVQPAFHSRWGGRGGEYETALGSERAMRTNDFPSLLAAGVVLAGGSDAFVTPLDPWAGMRAAMGRSDRRAVSAWEAVELFTSGVDYAGGEPSAASWLRTGAPAELVLFRATEEWRDLLRLGPEWAIVRGRLRRMNAGFC
jgi:predicted amidohydrolase YtcJ